MSVGKIALGVFLGNLATALLSWLMLSLVWQMQMPSIEAAAAHARLEAIQQGH